MIKIGLAGGIGSGKTFVSDTFAELGVRIIDADVVSRAITAPGAPSVAKIREHFGSLVVHKDGTLNRAELKKIIFENPKEKRWLENLLHPIIHTAIAKELEKPDSNYVILSSPLLFETGQDTLVDKVIVVDIPVETQLHRTCARDQSEERLIQKIIDSQWSREQRLKASDYVIDNSGSKASTTEQIHTLHKTLSQL